MPIIQIFVSALTVTRYIPVLAITAVKYLPILYKLLGQMHYYTTVSHYYTTVSHYWSKVFRADICTIIFSYWLHHCTSY